MDIVIEINPEGRFQRIKNFDAIRDHVPPLHLFSAFLAAADFALRAESSPKAQPIPKSDVVGPGTYELRFYANCIDATPTDKRPGFDQPYIVQVGGERQFRFHGTGLHDLYVEPILS